MKKYFIPDRSDRSESFNGITGTVTELPSLAGNENYLKDGRPFVTEFAVIDGIWHADYYYFDASDLEDASSDELGVLLEEVGIFFRKDKSFKGIFPELIKDTQNRDIWEVQILREPEE